MCGKLGSRGKNRSGFDRGVTWGCGFHSGILGRLRWFCLRCGVHSGVWCGMIQVRMSRWNLRCSRGGFLRWSRRGFLRWIKLGGMSNGCSGFDRLITWWGGFRGTGTSW